MKLHRYYYPDGNFELLYLRDYYPVDMYKQEFYNNHCNRLLDFRQNLDDALRYYEKIPKTERKVQCEQILERVHLPKEYLLRYPDQLSGGESCVQQNHRSFPW